MPPPHSSIGSSPAAIRFAGRDLIASVADGAPADAETNRSTCLAIPVEHRCIPKGQTMSKGNSKRGNKEAKKPKQEKPKVLATANALAGKPALSIGGKKPSKAM
jgi:hypothetical protein